MTRIKAYLMIAAVATSAAASGCDLLNQAGEATVSLSARVDDSASREVTAGTVVTTVDAYRVTFKKIEIGNSETDKYTLWESDGGEEFDIAEEIEFDGVAALPAGTYNYLRFTIGTTLSIDGSIVDGDVVYEGSGSETLDEETYLFGVDIPSGLGEATVADPIVISDGASLAIVFNIAGTVTYLSGSEDAALLSVVKPTITVETD